MKKKADLIIKAGQVVTCAPGDKPKSGEEMKQAGVINKGAVAVIGERIAGVGRLSEIESVFECSSDGIIDATTSVLMPGLVDSHTHPVFAGSRIDEYILRAKGATYLDIHKKGGGIISTVNATRKATDEELKERLRINLSRMLMHGTTTLEAKSGYGLEAYEEMRQLRLLREIQKEMPLDVMTTFLGAHTVPLEYRDKKDEYIELVRNQMLPLVAKEKLADFMDIFCEDGAFSVDESRELLEAAKELGIGLKIHAEQFTSKGATLMAAQLGAISSDHLLKLRKEDIPPLKGKGIILVFMPGTEIFLNIKEYGPARTAIDEGLPVAIGTDFNAGSCLSESMPMAMSIALLHMMMEPEEVINASTVNAAHSMGLGEKVGSIEPGKQADMILLDIEDYREWLYHFGVNLVKMVIKRGTITYKAGKLILQPEYSK